MGPVRNRFMGSNILGVSDGPGECEYPPHYLTREDLPVACGYPAPMAPPKRSSPMCDFLPGVILKQLFEFLIDFQWQSERFTKKMWASCERLISTNPEAHDHPRNRTNQIPTLADPDRRRSG